MSMYRREWDCCGSITETDAWEPEVCPFCTPADANKSAEEGGLPALPDWAVQEKFGNATVNFYVAHQMEAYALKCIAADRAARPVANKAEVEQDKIDAERYRWLRNHGDKEGQPPVMLQGRWHGGSNGVGFNLDEAVDSLMGIATPTATTGASTACYGASKPEQSCPCSECKAEVGASTVLTDERIDRVALEKAIEDRISAREDKMMICPPPNVNKRLIASRNALTATLDRLFAAQAGQVAVPEVAPPHWYDAPQEALGGRTAREGYAANPAYADLQPKATTWLPTPENVNELPEGVRQYVHDLVARCDPAGDVAALTGLRDQLDGVQLMYRKAADRVTELEAVLANQPAPTVPAASQEPSLLSQMAFIAAYDPDELDGGYTQEGMRAACRLKCIIDHARRACEAHQPAQEQAEKKQEEK